MALRLYRSLLKTSKQMKNYNFREYYLRRTKEAFRENKDLTDTEEINKALAHGQNEYQMLRRQAVISQLYDPQESYIIDEVRSK